MSHGQCGEGLQVVSVDADGTYRADEAALARVAAAAAARGLPVAVVSVAGATRGGKSFLLDFFLRYLRAPEEARRSGAWLGADDEPLTGFSWRGGCERDTSGIMLWSEPIIVSLGPEENSGKVAVLLMDTQGTFDSSSTIRDSSTIFALSTLLSSVQIFNLSQNILEDNLQYLQLFTEYGKLARLDSDDASSPFQVLQFLIRDWSYAYEHPIGAEGGQQLLDKRLEVSSSQARELREIRQHVRGAFEAVRCFLLPHPGLTVATSPRFNGRPADILSEFKNALLELVPSLLEPENLTLKRVNGQKITVQDLTEYFKTYVEIFNSDSLPTPTTVMQATSVASLEIALSATREEYCSYMERATGGETSVPRAAVPRAHAAALLTARDAFAARRTLADDALAAARRDALLQELDAMLPHYVAINNAKILAAVAAARAAYEAAMSEPRACLAPGALRVRHDAARAAARAELDASRAALPPDGEDEDGDTLDKELEDLLPLHRERNEERIARAVSAAREAYAARVRRGCAAAACLHPDSLRRLQRGAARASLDMFQQAWSDADSADSADNHHRTALLQDIEEQNLEFVRLNEANNEIAVEEALTFYDSRMSELFEGNISACLHPRELAARHGGARLAAVGFFLDRRDERGRDTTDCYRRSIETGLAQRYLRFKQLNEERNKEAIKRAHDHYLARIEPARVAGGAPGVLFGPVELSALSRHVAVMNEALELFRQQRLPGQAYDEDIHLDDLKKKINLSHAWLVAKICGNLGLGALSIGTLTAMIFRR